MRRILVAVIPIFVGACGRNDGPKPLIATADSVTSTSKSSKTPAPTPIDTSAPPMFTYDEEGTTLTYWSSGALRVVVTVGDASRACESALGEGDNMWTRSDVDAAFHDPDVKAAIARRAFFASAYPKAAELVAPEGKIDWWNEWDKPPPPEPAAVHQLHEVLHVVLQNRVSLCP